ncbi:glycosyltransferase [Pseudomonas gingeri]
MNGSEFRPRVAVLLAAYNGVRWLDEQLFSIFNQLGVDVTLFVSVDASCDGTEEYLKVVASERKDVVILPGGNKFGGAAKNFFHLIRYVDFSKFDYVSFSDQDDIWFNDKLIHAHELIVKKNVSAYSGNVLAFWSDGRKLLIDKAQKQKKIDFLFEAAGPGCSYVLKVPETLRFKKFLLDNWALVNEFSLHDWLIYAWFRHNGYDWYIDPIPKIHYRQHESNQVGANVGIKAIKARISLIRKGWYRQEVSKLMRLLGDSLDSSNYLPIKGGKPSLLFLLMNFPQMRRKIRDQWLLLIAIIMNIY